MVCMVSLKEQRNVDKWERNDNPSANEQCLKVVSLTNRKIQSGKGEMVSVEGWLLRIHF